MLKLTISRNDSIYECFPDIARTPDGTLVCIYRECMMHAPFPFSRIAVRRSLDGGMNWLEREVLIDCVAKAESVAANRSWLSQDAIKGYEESLARITADWQIGASINCPRIICLPDGTLFLVGDFTLPAPGDPSGHLVLDKAWRSTDGGATWSGPEDLRVEQTGYQPALTQLRDGRLLLGLDVGRQSAVCFSPDGGRSWGPTVFLPQADDSPTDETNYVELDDGTLVGFARNGRAESEQRPSSGLKVISQDGGKTWAGPFPTWLVGLEGRPKAGLLASGEVCVTYRCGMPNELLAMHVMTQEAARFAGRGAMVPRQPSAEDIPGREAAARGEERPWYMTSYYPGRSFVIDTDRSVHRDGGYSGWVQLPSGEILVVDYTNDDAPLAQIRGYLINRSDYILFPDGDLPWLHPSWQPFTEMTLGMAQRQQAKNRGQQL